MRHHVPMNLRDLEPRIICQVHAQKSSSATHDTILGAPEVDLVWPMNRNDIVMDVESLEARPGCNLWLLIIFGGALPFIFKLFESKRAGGEYGGVDDAHVGDTALTGGDSRRSSARIVKKQKCHHSACDDCNSGMECFGTVCHRENYVIMLQLPFVDISSLLYIQMNPGSRQSTITPKTRNGDVLDLMCIQRLGYHCHHFHQHFQLQMRISPKNTPFVAIAD